MTSKRENPIGKKKVLTSLVHTPQLYHIIFTLAKSDAILNEKNKSRSCEISENLSEKRYFLTSTHFLGGCK